MRKNMLMLLAAALLVVTGCKKDNKTENNGEKMIFTATIDNGAKTQINGFDQVWNTGDKVKINGEEFTVTPKAGDPSWATFEGQTVNPDGEGKYKAIFPNSYYVSEDLYNFPATQTYDGNNLSKVNPLYAKSTTQELVFHNICALMKLTLRGNDTDKVTEIKVSADQALSGYFEVKERGEGYFAELVTSEGSADVTLMCGDGVALTEEGTAFYIAIPEYDDYSNLTFTATTSEGKTWTYKANGGANIAIYANKLYESIQTPEFTPSLPAGALAGVFTVSNDDGTTKTQIYFSQGNLYYDGSKFNFEANQYDATPSSKGSWNAEHVSHFFWSKDERVAYSNNYNTANSTYGISPAATDVFFTNADETTAKEGFTVNVDGKEQSGWRTLSTNEWQYLFYTRTMKNGKDRYTLNITYGGKMGLVLYPDDYDKDPVTGTVTNLPDGVVFLPAAGYRNGSNVNEVGVNGYYWSPTAIDVSLANDVYFLSNYVYPDSFGRRDMGYSVRLVTESK